MTAEIQIRETTGMFGKEPQLIGAGAIGEVRITSASGILESGTAYFRTAAWQEGEIEAEKDIRSGRLRRFDDPAEAIEHLREL